LAKTALVISGGGSKGAFAVGAIEVLREAGVRFDLVTGSSTGALIAPLVATDEIALLRKIYSSVRTADVLTARSGALDIWTAGSVYDTAPLWNLINTYITDERYTRVLRAAAEIFLCAVDLQTAEVTYFNPKRGTGGPMSRLAFNRAILASASQPVLMPSVRLTEGGDQFVDGGVREMAPIRKAIAEGATVVFAVVLSPAQQARQDKAFVGVTDTLLRSLDLLLDEISANDVDDAVFYNRALAYLGRVRARVAELTGQEPLADIFEDAAADNPFRGRLPLDLRIIRPKEPLPSDGLTFSPLIMSEMMSMGSAAARDLLG
jgi:NTE family protein